MKENVNIFKSTKKPRVVPKVVKESKKSFFGDKGHIKRPDFREKLRKDCGKIPGYSGRYTKRQREEIEKDFSFKEAGTYIDEKDMKYRLKQMGKKKYKAKTHNEKKEIDKRMKYLEKFK